MLVKVYASGCEEAPDGLLVIKGGLRGRPAVTGFSRGPCRIRVETARRGMEQHSELVHGQWTRTQQILHGSDAELAAAGIGTRDTNCRSTG